MATDSALTSQFDASGQASQGQPDSTSGAAPQSLAEQMASGQSDKPEVVSLEDFRNMRSIKDRELAAERNARVSLEAQMNRQRDEMQAQIDNIAMQTMTSEQQMQLRLQRAEERAQREYYARVTLEQNLAGMQAKEREWAAISSKHGVSRQQLEAWEKQGALPFELWMLADDWKIANGNQRNSKPQERDIRPATQTEMGAGAPRPAANEFQRKRQDALQNNDADAFWDNWLEAEQAGAPM